MFDLFPLRKSEISADETCQTFTDIFAKNALITTAGEIPILAAHHIRDRREAIMNGKGVDHD